MLFDSYETNFSKEWTFAKRMINKNTWKCSHGEHPLCEISSSQGYIPPMIHMPCVSSKHRSPFGLLRLGRPWLQGKGRKEIKACTETIIWGDKLEFHSSLAGPAEWPSALSVCSDRNLPTAASEADTHCCRLATPQSKHFSMWADKCMRKLLLANEFIRVLWES